MSACYLSLSHAKKMVKYKPKNINMYVLTFCFQFDIEIFLWKASKKNAVVHNFKTIK